jgi:hypothetical protein
MRHGCDDADLADPLCIMYQIVEGMIGRKGKLQHHADNLPLEREFMMVPSNVIGRHLLPEMIEFRVFSYSISSPCVRLAG